MPLRTAELNYYRFGLFCFPHLPLLFLSATQNDKFQWKVNFNALAYSWSTAIPAAPTKPETALHVTSTLICLNFLGVVKMGCVGVASLDYAGVNCGILLEASSSSHAKARRDPATT